ncbi:MAG: hypothetical protein KOO60_03165 [Gemmatimonadales bacterium]|nr:hypothetical protein [Gemmatimonadales bacterium]
MIFLGSIGPELPEAWGMAQGASIWQTAGGLLTVFGLLILSLRFLGKWQRRTRQGKAALLTVWNLGPRREIQVLRLQDEVHYIYRHDGAMVLLKNIPFSAWETSLASSEDQETTPRDLLGKIFSKSNLADPKPAL